MSFHHLNGLFLPLILPCQSAYSVLILHLSFPSFYVEQKATQVQGFFYSCFFLTSVCGNHVNVCIFYAVLYKHTYPVLRLLKSNQGAVRLMKNRASLKDLMLCTNFPVSKTCTLNGCAFLRFKDKLCKKSKKKTNSLLVMHGYSD